MKNFYEMNTDITATMSDTAFKIKLSAILEMIQDAQTFHSKLMNVDAPSLRRDCNAFWVITATKLRIYQSPVWQQEVKVLTYPIKPSILRGERQNGIYDQDGNLMIAGKTDWCILDCDTHKPRKFSSISTYPFDMEHKSERIFQSQSSQQSIRLEKSDYKYTKQIKYSELDFNHHVNNVRYIDYIMNCFDSTFWEARNITDFEIYYEKEAPENSSIDIYAAVRDNEITFCGQSGETVIFKAKITAPML